MKIKIKTNRGDSLLGAILLAGVVILVIVGVVVVAKKIIDRINSIVPEPDKEEIAYAYGIDPNYYHTPQTTIELEPPVYGVESLADTYVVYWTDNLDLPWIRLFDIELYPNQVQPFLWDLVRWDVETDQWAREQGLFGQPSGFYKAVND